MTTIPKDDLLHNARHHVREGADRAARQEVEVIVVRLDRIGAVELAKQDILTTLKTSLRLAREDPARLNSPFGDAPSTIPSTLLGWSGS